MVALFLLCPHPEPELIFKNLLAKRSGGSHGNWFIASYRSFITRPVGTDCFTVRPGNIQMARSEAEMIATPAMISFNGSCSLSTTKAVIDDHTGCVEYRMEATDGGTLIWPLVWAHCG